MSDRVKWVRLTPNGVVHALRFPWMTFCGRSTNGGGEATGKACARCERFSPYAKTRIDFVYNGLGVGVTRSPDYANEYRIEVFDGTNRVEDFVLNHVNEKEEVVSLAKSIVDKIINGHKYEIGVTNSPDYTIAVYRDEKLPGIGKIAVVVDVNGDIFTFTVGGYAIRDVAPSVSDGDVPIVAILNECPHMLFSPEKKQ